ncbi:MAG: hypothetical protein ACPG5W_13335, partial [Flavobacteriales bacterium]
HVTGSIRMEDGNQTAGYIPVSDANGKMVWTNPTTITTSADADGDASNELQTLSQTGTNVTLSNGGGTVSVADNDNSTSNEIQTLSISGNDISLSNGGGTVSVANDGDWISSGNHLYNGNSGAVGIGTTNPVDKFNVNGTSNSYMRFTHATSGSSSSDGFRVGLNGQLEAILVQKENKPMLFMTNGAEQMRIKENGFVGVGTASPTEKLHVVGSIRMQDGNQQAGFIPVSTANGKMVWTDPTTVSDGDWTVSGNNIYNSNSGNVGIGYSTPNHHLDVVDDRSPLVGSSMVDVTELQAMFRNTSGANGQAAGIGFATGGPNLAGAAIIHERTSTNSEGKLHFATNGNGNSGY